MLPKMRPLVRRVAVEVIYRSGLIRHLRRNEWCIIIYHSISPHEGPYTRGIGITVTPETLDQHLSYFAGNYRIVALSELVQNLQLGKTCRGMLALTFDDGFQDNYRYALPILRRYEAPATIFVCTKVLDTSLVLWQNRFAYAVNMAGAARVNECVTRRWPELTGCIRTSVVAEFRRMIGPRIPHAAIVEFLKETYCELGLLWHSTERIYLNTREMKEMAGCGVEFGSHTCSHANLALLDEREMIREVEGARARIADVLPGGAPIPFSYPFGGRHSHSERTAQVVRDTGHYCALLSTPEPPLPNHTPDLYALGRTSLPSPSMAEVACRTAGIVSMRAHFTSRARAPGTEWTGTLYRRRSG
jgi:peptidoglycan/xylan/chitin deacetylase (PgdA/CDA1 family)